MRKRKPLIWRLFPSYLLITLLSLLAVSWFASTYLRNFYLDQTATDLRTRAVLIEKLIIPELVPLDVSAVDSICKDMGKLAETRITVILHNGNVIGDSHEIPHQMDNHANRPEIATALKGSTGRATRFSNTLMQQMMYIAVPINFDQRIIGVIRTSLPTTAIDKELHAIQFKITLVGILIALFAAGISLYVSRRITRPIEQMKAGADHFAAGDLTHRLSPPQSLEMAGLAEAMNQMAVQLDSRIKTIISQRNELETVLASMLEGVIAIDNEERFLNINQAAAKLFDCDPADIQGLSIQEVIRNLELQQFIHTALSSPEPQEDDITIFQDNERVLNVKSSALLDAGHRRVGTLVVFNDVTRLRRLENMRKDFVANVSHEIKTPLTAIKGFVETLQQGNVETPSETERFLGIINKHVDRLNSIIEDLLTLSKIEQEDEHKLIKLEKTYILDVFHSAIQICRAKAEEKNITIEIDCEESLNAGLDPTLVEQAVVNLLDNAIKYSEPDHPVILEAHSEPPGIKISVKDQGMGIGKKHLPRLFERFYRVDKARSRKLGGTGLGLAIVKHIAQAHRGHISVESDLGQGSTFTIHLPPL